MRIKWLETHEHLLPAVSAGDDAFARVLVVENELDALRDAVGAETAEWERRARERADALAREAPDELAAALGELDALASRERADAIAATTQHMARVAEAFAAVSPAVVEALARAVARRALGLDA